MRRVFTVFALALISYCQSTEDYLLYWREQDQEKAFRCFLKALDSAEKKPSLATSSEEQKLYEEALSNYLDHSGAATPQSTALKLLETYGQTAKEHPDYHQLPLVLATAYANLGRFEEFFTTFYAAYCRYPESYLSYKTKAVLHIKLYERSAQAADKEIERRAIRHNVDKALEKNPQDIALYKLWLIFAEEQNKQGEVATCLKKILGSPMIISRSDLSFFIQQAIDARQFEGAERLIAKGRSWYPYSRNLDAAQESLDRYKGAREK